MSAAGTGGEASCDGYDEGFYALMRSSGRASADVVVPLLLQWLRPRSVIDVGCALGTWLAAFAEGGVEDLLGLDGPDVEPSFLDIPAAGFRTVDLAAQVVMEARRWDVAVSLEVAEHLPPERAEGFVADLARLAPVVVFSAAVPHQGGTHHVNEQWPDYWSRLFAQHGLHALDVLRPLVWGDDRVAWWYQQNLVLYVTAEARRVHPSLDHLARWPGEHPARLVHPHRYLEWAAYATDVAAATDTAR